MAQRIPLVQVMLIFSLAILILSELVSAQDNCVNHQFYCNEDPSAGQLIPCCDGEKCVVSQYSNNCDCAAYGEPCGDNSDLPCCKGGICYMGGGGYCGVPCAGLNQGCDDRAFCCDGLVCGGSEEEAAHCVPSREANGTNAMSNNGTTNGF